LNAIKINGQHIFGFCVWTSIVGRVLFKHEKIASTVSPLGFYIEWFILLADVLGDLCYLNVAALG
jgi:hypothetical protein